MLYAAKPPERIIAAAERRGDALYLSSEYGRFRIAPMSDKIIRVSFTREGEFSTSPRPSVVATEGFSDWSFSESEREITLSTGQIRLIVSRDASSLAFYSDGEKPLLKCGRITLEKFSVYGVSEAITEKIKTADGEKEVVTQAKRTEQGHSYHARLNLEFSDGEALYGLGQHEEGFGSLRGETVYLHQANRKIAVPLLVSSLGYGIFCDCYSPMIFSDTAYGSYLYSEAVPELDFYFLLGPNMNGVISRYRYLTGKASMLPRWAFGYIQSQERYETADEILSVAKSYRDESIPLDCIVLDWCSWEDGKWGEKLFDRSRFPRPEEMISKLHENHIHFMMSVWANASEATENYREFKEAGLLLTASTVYNALGEKGRRLYWQQLSRELFKSGVDAWWCDNSEPFTPEWNHIERPEPSTMYAEYCRDSENSLPAEYTNSFGLYHAEGVYEGQRSETDKKRVFNLTRSGCAGQQRFGAVLWSGDISASWETLRKQIAAGLNFCASGLPYWTTDIGAFFVRRGNMWYWDGDFDACFDDEEYCELFTRWFQWAAFLPIFRGHGTDCRRELTVLKSRSPRCYEAVLKALRQRYELMPYIYSAAGECSIGDGSMLKNLAFDFRDDKAVLDITDQYMFGSSLMVCPIYSRQTSPNETRRVYLPSGCGWYDFYTAERFDGGRYIDVPISLDKIPVFVREGSIIPTAAPALSTEEQSRDITLRIFSRSGASCTLYEDSFDGYGYERGEYIFTDISWLSAENRLTAARRTDWQISPEEEARRYRIEGKVIYK